MPNYKNDPTEEFDVIEFTSNDLTECLTHFKREGDAEPLENAIDLINDKIEKANVQLQFMVDLFRGLEKDHYANRMIEIINTLK